MTRKEFEIIILRLRPLMVKVGRDFFGNQMDAEDVAQEALLRLWKYCERLDADRNLEALADAMGNLQYQHPIDFATSRPIILNELRDVHFRWHDASEEQAEKYWQVRMTTEEKE